VGTGKGFFFFFFFVEEPWLLFLVELLALELLLAFSAAEDSKAAALPRASDRLSCHAAGSKVGTPLTTTPSFSRHAPFILLDDEERTASSRRSS